MIYIFSSLSLSEEETSSFGGLLELSTLQSLKVMMPPLGRSGVSKLRVNFYAPSLRLKSNKLN
jgi:hypothetical protein